MKPPSCRGESCAFPSLNPLYKGCFASYWGVWGGHPPQVSSNSRLFPASIPRCWHKNLLFKKPISSCPPQKKGHGTKPARNGPESAVTEQRRSALARMRQRWREVSVVAIKSVSRFRTADAGAGPSPRSVQGQHTWNPRKFSCASQSLPALNEVAFLLLLPGRRLVGWRVGESAASQKDRTG